MRRQRKTIKNAKSPPEIYKDQFTDEEFQTAKNYALDKINFSILMDVVDTIESIIEVFILSKLWKLTAIFESEIIHSLIFLALSSVLSTILSIPSSYYSNFVIEQKYGFNNLTIKLWLTDKVKSLIINLIISSILIPIIIFIYNKAGAKFVLVAQIIIVILSLVLNVIAPILIIPLFTVLTPIVEGPIYDSISKLCQESEFNIGKIYEADDSKRSSHTNAMVFGLFTKKIALADTLVKNSTPEKIAAVVGHEIGHSKHHHILKQFLISQVSTSLMLTTLYFVMSLDKPFVEFGFSDKPLIAGIIITTLIATPFSDLLDLPLNMLSRYMERQADEFAALKGLPLDEALIDLVKDNKSPIEPDPLYAAFVSSHPTTVERVKFVREIQKKLKKKD
ncbi:Clan MA, family M48, Ste24 endopeptidase-like metallopeptidase [Histomonas meleagridis]|uniref:Clan MA, family M48, Ste24 endopeptidase-like metallopeptidase n=1 Tax=Histomonas meleagridis TaxID=135588 RepID=UPI003559708E|nr:Clan MA, family M48, Ste24 endopeptidase-like metallopeptidase [Histomonas meleagridis]KAH0800076.1 Clan MA, family M48, Ste24 endopeptidase-like metallopeptidase [Histomonas meleagridis]